MATPRGVVYFIDNADSAVTAVTGRCKDESGRESGTGGEAFKAHCRPRRLRERGEW